MQEVMLGGGLRVNLGYLEDEYISNEREKIDTMTCKFSEE